MIKFKYLFIICVLICPTLRAEELQLLIENKNCKNDLNYLFEKDQSTLIKDCDDKYPIQSIDSNQFTLITRKEILEKYWGDGEVEESTENKIFFYLPRLLEQETVNAAKIIWSVANRVWNLPYGIYKILNPTSEDLRSNKDKGSAILGESIISPLTTVNDIVSDSIRFIRIPFTSATKDNSSNYEVKACSINLLNSKQDLIKNNLGSKGNFIISPLATVFNPAKHIGIMINQGNRSVDLYDNRSTKLTETLSEDSIKCTRIKKRSSEPEAISIIRLACIWNNYYNKSHYNFIADNCGSFVKRILDVSGYEFLETPNFGISTEVSITVSEESQRIVKSNNAVIDEAQENCNQNISIYRKVLKDLELGNPINDDDINIIQSILNHRVIKNQTPEVFLQLLISAIKGNNKTILQFLEENLNDSLYTLSYEDPALERIILSLFDNDCKLDGNRTIKCLKSHYYKMFSELMIDLNLESLILLEKSHPKLKKLIDILEQLKIASNQKAVSQ